MRCREAAGRSGILLLAALWFGCARGPVKLPPRAPLRGPVLRVLTYNVNFGQAGDRDTIAAIRDSGADLALLQETNLPWERVLRAALTAQFPHMAFQNRGGGGGMAVLSRWPLAEVEFLKPPASGWFPALRAVVETPLGKIQVLSVHLHPPVSEGGSVLSGYFTTGRARLDEIEAFFARLSPALPTLIAGDFNEESDGDVTKFLVAKGMAAAVSPDQPTWRWSTGVGTIRKQLDHVMVDHRLEAVAGEVRVAGHSDHLPVIATVQARP